MFIDPIQVQQIGSTSDLQSVSSVSPASKTAEIPFVSLFTDAMDNVSDTAAVLDNETLKLATGQTDDLHDITIASTKYSLAVDLFVQIRNKSLDAYNQLMNMNI